MTQVGTGVTTYSYDSAGRLSNTTDPFGDNTNYAYDSAGRLSKRSLANGTYEAFLYDAQSRVTEIRTMKVVLPEGPDTLIKSRAYTFDLASQVTSVVEGGITTDYAYDLAGQLTSEVKSSGYSASYSYDANGNRLSRTVNGVTENYSYDAGDKLLAVTGGVDPRNFVYDAAGRTTSIQRASGNTNFTYDYESRVTSITKPGMVTNSMSYNGLGTRVGLVDSGGSKQYVRDGVGVTAPVLSDGASTFTAGGERTAGVSKTLHSGLKNDDLQTNASGSVIGERLYDAFGNVVSNSGAWSSHSGYGGKFGYQDDADSSLKLLGHRYYDSSTGRFLVRDRIKDGRNWYSYCGNNPVNAMDADGLKERALTDTERGQVQASINRLREDGYKKEADRLQALLDAGKIKYDDDYSGYGVEKYGFIVLGKKFFDLFKITDGPKYASQRRRARLIFAASILLHEIVHVIQPNPKHRWNINDREREAYNAQIMYLNKMLKSDDDEMTRFTKLFLAELYVIAIGNAGDYGWKASSKVPDLSSPSTWGGARR